MFAFALWDPPRKRLFAARDRLGQKPFYYYRDAHRLAFASEIGALEAWPGLDLSLDETALYDFLTYIYVPAPKTPYVHVRKLLPGHSLIFENNRLFIDPYWEVRFASPGVKARGDAVAETRAALDDAVRTHLIADVPVGSLLSGGIDSSTVIALAARHVRDPIHTFAIGFDVAEHSETEFARAVAEHVGTRHVEETVSVARAEELVPRLAGMTGEPFADSSIIPTHIVCAIARKSVKVVLSGDGGDEVFGGDGWYGRHLKRARFAHVPRVLREHLPALLERTAVASWRGMPTIVDGLRPDLERHVAILGGFTRAQKRQILTPSARARFREYDDLWAFRPHFHEDLDPLSRWQYLDLKTYLPDDILAKVDRASMAVGLEVRPPLLDHVLVEQVAALPVGVRNPRFAMKHLLKAAAADLLPRSILERKKKGFSVPMASWIARLGGRVDLPPMQAWILLGLGAFAARRAIENRLT